METIKPTINLFIDQRRVKKNGRFPVKLTVYYAANKQRYNTKYELTSLEWEKINGDKLRDDNLKKIKRELAALVDKAQTIADLLQPFSFDEFEDKFINKPKRQIANFATTIL